jgi:hypothetical protein
MNFEVEDRGLPIMPCCSVPKSFGEFKEAGWCFYNPLKVYEANDKIIVLNKARSDVALCDSNAIVKYTRGVATLLPSDLYDRVALKDISVDPERDLIAAVVRVYCLTSRSYRVFCLVDPIKTFFDGNMDYRYFFLVKNSEVGDTFPFAVEFYESTKLVIYNVEVVAIFNYENGKIDLIEESGAISSFFDISLKSQLKEGQLLTCMCVNKDKQIIISVDLVIYVFDRMLKVVTRQTTMRVVRSMCATDESGVWAYTDSVGDNESYLEYIPLYGNVSHKVDYEPFRNMQHFAMRGRADGTVLVFRSCQAPHCANGMANLDIVRKKP